MRETPPYETCVDIARNRLKSIYGDAFHEDIDDQVLKYVALMLHYGRLVIIKSGPKQE